MPTACEVVLGLYGIAPKPAVSDRAKCDSDGFVIETKPAVGAHGFAAEVGHILESGQMSNQAIAQELSARLLLCRNDKDFDRAQKWAEVELDRGLNERNAALDKAFKLYHGATPNGESRSRYISSETKRIVWERDDGQCVECGSRHEIHFDHELPWSKGGSNGPENIRLLCATCNLSKGDRIE